MVECNYDSDKDLFASSPDQDLLSSPVTEASPDYDRSWKLYADFNKGLYNNDEENAEYPFENSEVVELKNKIDSLEKENQTLKEEKQTS